MNQLDRLRARLPRTKTGRGRGRVAIDMTGQVFGRLTVIARATWITTKARHANWLCDCECGETVVCRGNALRNGYHLSCGCWRRDASRERALAFKGSGCNQFGRHDRAPGDWREERRRLRALGHEIKQFEGVVYLDGRPSDNPSLRAA